MQRIEAVFVRPLYISRAVGFFLLYDFAGPGYRRQIAHKFATFRDRSAQVVDIARQQSDACTAIVQIARCLQLEQKLIFARLPQDGRAAVVQTCETAKRLL